jgi:thiamine-phosphate pyrophosphorylase
MTSFALPRFYPIVDTSALRGRGVAPLAVFEALVAGGAAIIQLRHKAEWTREVFGLAQEMAAKSRSAGVTFVVNDRADVALAVGAEGVHLGQTDLTPYAVRSFAGDRLIIGLSTHNEEQLRAAAAEPADYLALGPVFGTQSKERPDPIVGVAELGRLRSLTPRPLVAIGGITRGNAGSVWSAGANSCAVIADYLSGDWRTSIGEWIRLAQEEGGT